MEADAGPQPDRCMWPVRCYSTWTAAHGVSGALIATAPLEMQLAYYPMSAAMPVNPPALPATRRSAGGGAS